MERIKQFKLVYPSLTAGNRKQSGQEGDTALSTAARTMDPMVTGQSQIMQDDHLDASTRGRPKSHKRRGRVSEAVAPKTMFLRLQGQTNPDVIQQTNMYLNKYASMICSVDNVNSTSLPANVRLLRETVPRCPNPYVKNGKSLRADWNNSIVIPPK